MRHGETVGNSSERFFGSTDIALSELGREQVGSLGPRLAEERFAALLHSPMARARSSAEVLGECLRYPPKKEDIRSVEAFREIDFGAIEGLTAAEIEKKMPDWYRSWRRGEVTGYPQGDNIQGFRARVAAGFDRIVNRYPVGDLLVVVHKGIIMSAMRHLLGWSEQDVRSKVCDLGSLSIITIGDRSEVEEFNWSDRDSKE